MAEAVTAFGTAALLVALATRWRSRVAKKHEVSAMEGRYMGLKELIAGREPSIDVCFVHGLGGDPDNALGVERSDQDPQYWPHSVLGPIDKNRFRVLSYGYSSYSPSSYYLTQRTLYLHAQNLTMDLLSFRKSTGTTERPIIFVAHSLGGILLKNALVHSHNSFQPYGEHSPLQGITMHTCGIVFYDPDDVLVNYKTIEAALRRRLTGDVDMDQLESDTRVLVTKTDMFKAIGEGIPQYGISKDKDRDLSPVRNGEVTAYGDKFKEFCDGAGTVTERKSLQHRVVESNWNQGENFKVDFIIPHFANPKFVDYSESLKRLTDLFESEHVDQISIQGLPGTGKTELTLQYIEKNKARYDSVLWINSNTIGEIIFSYACIAKQLFGTVETQQLPGTTVLKDDDLDWPFVEQDFSTDDVTESFTTVVDSVLAWLLRPGNINWLIIFDGMNRSSDMKQFWRFVPPVANGVGRIIITGRTIPDFEGRFKCSWKDNAILRDIELGRPSNGDLGNLFLANLDMNLRSDIRRRFNRPSFRPLVFPADEDPVEIALDAAHGDDAFYRDVSGKLQRKRFYHMQKLSWEAESVMSISCELSEAVIPVVLFLAAAPVRAAVIEASEPRAVSAKSIAFALDELSQAGHLLFDKSGYTIRLGRATRQFYHERNRKATRNAQQPRQIACELLADTLKKLNSCDPEPDLDVWPLSVEAKLRLEQMLLPHLLKVLQFNISIQPSSKEIFILIAKRHGQYLEALNFVDKQRLAMRNPFDQARATLNRLSLRRLLNKKVDPAEMLAELDEVERFTRGQVDDKLRFRLERLLYNFRCERWSTTIEQLQLVLLGLERPTTQRGKDYFTQVACLRILAASLKKLGRNAEAEAVLGRLLMTLENSVGPNHPLTHQTARSLARVCEQTGDHDLAYRLFTTLLRRTDNLLGELHPITLSVLTEVALVLSFQGKQDLATNLFAVALKGAQDALGSCHPLLLEMQELQGLSFWSAGDHGKAMNEYKKVNDAKASKKEFYTEESIRETRLRLMAISA